MAERKVAKDGGGDGTPQHRLDRAIRDGLVQEPNAGNGPYHCKICQKQLKNKETIKSHLTTQAHMKKENESTFAAKGAPYTGHNAQARSVDTSPADELNLAIQNGQVAEVDKGGESYHCKVCNKNLTKGRIRRHLSSQTHTNKLPKIVLEHDGRNIGRTSLKHSQSSGDDDDEPDIVEDAFAENVLQERNDVKGKYWCSVCNQHLKIYNKLENHLYSQKHNNKLPLETTPQRINKTSEESSGDDDDEPDIVEDAFAENVLQERNDVEGQYWCRVCNQHLKIYNRLANHLLSQKHNNKLPLETTPQRISKTYEEENSGSSEGEDETDPVNIAFKDGVLVEYKGEDPPYYCNICLQPLKIYGKLSNHLQSKKHKEKIEMTTLNYGSRLSSQPERHITSSPEVTSPEMTRPEVTIHEVISPEVTRLEVKTFEQKSHPKDAVSNTVHKGIHKDVTAYAAMVVRAISNAKNSFDINLRHGTPNTAQGNCLFEAVIDNINSRDCYEETLEKSVQEYRSQWMSEGEEQIKNTDLRDRQISDATWRRGWHTMRQDGVYEVEYYGDLMILAIAYSLQKDILIFNVHDDAHSPIYVIEASKLGGQRNSDIPIVLAYNGVHYESMVPVRQEDIDKTVLLAERFVNNQSNKRWETVPFAEKASDDDTETLLLGNDDP